jgi:hypothetical protein
VADAVEALARIAPRTSVRSLRGATEASALAGARTCYDHLAGKLGVAVTDALQRRGAVRRIDGVFVAGSAVEAVLGAIGVDFEVVSSARRPFALSCLDWTERRPHLAGALGAAIANRALDAGWVRRRGESRALDLTEDGRLAFATQLGVDLPS